MATATLPTNAVPGQGLRPISFQHDLSQVADLIELCFSAELDRHGRSAVNEMRSLSRLGPLFGALNRLFNLNGSPLWSDGFVWVEDGKVVGNISMQPSDTRPDVWLIANVAVHPDYRRRGLAANLTQAALALAHKRRGTYAQLQVDRKNIIAQGLYYGLGFQHLTTRTTWERPRTSNLPIPIPTSDVEIRPLRGSEWRDDFNLLSQYSPHGLEWTRPLRERDFRPSIFTRIDNTMQGRNIERWGAFVGPRQVAHAQIITLYGALTRLSVAIHPHWSESLLQPLVVRLLVRNGRVPWSVRLDYPHDDTNDALSAIGFHPLRSLIWMGRKLAS